MAALVKTVKSIFSFCFPMLVIKIFLVNKNWGLLFIYLLYFGCHLVYLPKHFYLKKDLTNYIKMLHNVVGYQGVFAK